jgi:hypothetical protein
VEIGNPDAGQSTQGPAARDPAEHSDPNQPAGKKKKKKRERGLIIRAILKKKKNLITPTSLPLSI